jgi:hypothetical protein
MSSPRCPIEATLDDFIRVLKPGSELILVNHIGAETGPPRLRTGVRRSRSGSAGGGISMGASGQLGGETRRRQPDRAPPGTMRAFLADRYRKS